MRSLYWRPIFRNILLLSQRTFVEILNRFNVHTRSGLTVSEFRSTGLASIDVAEYGYEFLICSQGTRKRVFSYEMFHGYAYFHEFLQNRPLMFNKWTVFVKWKYAYIMQNFKGIFERLVREARFFFFLSIAQK